MNQPIFVTEIEIASADEMMKLGERLGAQLRAGDLAILTGELGAGKTTFSRGVGEGMGVRGPVTSPTFVLARTHPSLVGAVNLVHVDAYRLNSPDELDDLDIDFEGSVVLVEWGRGMVQEMENWLEIDIVRPVGGEDIDFETEDEPRMITIRGFGDRWKRGLDVTDRL